METIISKLLSRYEKGSLSRRELVSGLAMLAAGGTGASAAQNELDFKDANIDHISIHVADLQRSIDFYQKMFGFSVVSRADPEIVRLGNGKTLVSINRGSPARTIDHFSIGIPRFNADAASRHVTQRGAMPLRGDYAGFHIKDPDGINVQISQT
jgi:glyoxylase I family protein